MSGFSNPLVGGSGALVYPSIHSPDFVHGSAGWSIDKDGTAEFQDVILPGGLGVKVTFAATAPAGPHAGDLWYNTSAGLELSQWNGSAWVAYQIGSGAILPGSITAALLQAGIVVAGIINGTVVTGSTLQNSTSDPRTEIDPSGNVKITNSSGTVIFQIAANGTLTWYDSSSNVLMQLSPTGYLSIQDPAHLQFPSGAALEQNQAVIQSTLNGTSPAQYIQLAIEGASTTTTGAHDRVFVTFNSAAADNSSDANMQLVYVGSNGTAHEYAFMDATGFNLIPGTVVGPQPGVSPATPESWHQMTLANSFSAGVNNGFTDAPSYAILPCNPYYGSGSGKCVAFRGTLATPGSGTVTGVTFATLPSGYTPQAGPFSRLPVVNLGGGQAGHVELHSNGNLQLGGNFAAGTSIDLTGITFI